VAILSAIGYRSVHGLWSPAPLVSLWPVGPVASPSLGGIGEAHAPGAAADAVECPRFSKPSCPARLILFSLGVLHRVWAGALRTR
jgi:hypothetical protein